VDELKKERYNASRKAKGKGDGMNTPVTAGGLCGKLGMSRQDYYKAHMERQKNGSGGRLTTG
jgi:hypothetical protein